MLAKRPGVFVVVGFVLGLVVAWGVGQAAAPKKNTQTQDELRNEFYNNEQGIHRYSAVTDGAGGILFFDQAAPTVIKHILKAPDNTYGEDYIVPVILKN